MELATLLADCDIDPAQTLVFRHRPLEVRLQHVLGWLAQEDHALFDLYQSTHGPRTEAALDKANYLASFVGHTPGRAVFVGLYRQLGGAFQPGKEIAGDPSFKRLVELGMRDWNEAVRDSMIFRFDLQPLDLMAQWKGKLIIDWPSPDRAWYRWGDPARNRFPVAAIREESLLVRDMPGWEDLLLNWAELQAQPESWRRRLSEWRGVYLIFDSRDGKRYVGSATGAENLLGRWLGYARSGHGGNQLLRGRDPAGFQFSILQRVSPDLSAEAVVAIESSWKRRLHSRAPWGLNAN